MGRGEGGRGRGFVGSSAALCGARQPRAGFSAAGRALCRRAGHAARAGPGALLQRRPRGGAAWPQPLSRCFGALQLRVSIR